MYEVIWLSLTSIEPPSPLRLISTLGVLTAHGYGAVANVRGNASWVVAGWHWHGIQV